MAINSKKKGNRNERNLTKLWNTWTGWEFNRVPASGGLRWKKTDNISGDIICTEPGIINFKFSIEAKNHKDLGFNNLLNGNKKCKIKEFWEQAKADGVRANKIPILFMRCNGMKSDMHFVVLGFYTYKTIKRFLPNEYGRLRFNSEIIIINSGDLFNSNFDKIYHQSYEMVYSSNRF